MTHSSIEAAEARHEELTAALADAKLHAAEASALSRVAGKEDRVSATIAAAQARNEVTRLTAEVKVAAKAVKDAEARVAASEKEAAKTAAIRAAEARREEQAENPFVAYEISWPALGAWLAGRLKDRVCYVEGAGWGQWVGSHWEFAGVKPSAELLDLVRRTYALGGDGPIVEKLDANARAGADLLAHAQGALTLPRSLFNSREVSHLLAFKNTTINLRTGERVPHNPQHYMTGALQCRYNPLARADRIARTFARFWPNDKETARIFQMALGYSATGEVSAKRLMMMVGNQDEALKNGDNGKSLVQNAIVRLNGLGVGGWGAAVKAALIVDTGDRDANSHDGAKTPLIWKRFAMGSEFRNGASIDAGEFNRISGGDVQTARPPHGTAAVEFVNAATIWISMNSVPRFKTSDKATRRRLTPFPFTETFYDPEDCPEGGQLKELGLEQWLESQQGMEALGLYVVQGAIAFYKHNGGKAGNLPDSAAMLELRDRILRDGNPFSDLFEECFEFDQAFDLKQSAVTTLLHVWNGDRPKPHEKQQFISALKGMGVVEIKVRGERYFRGVGFTGEGMKRYGAKNTDNPQISRAGPVVVPMAAIK